MECKTALQWIDVKDRLPVENGYYLIVCNSRRCLAEYINNTWYTNEFIDPFKGKDIRFESFSKLCEWTQENTTHWMELPESPK